MSHKSQAIKNRQQKVHLQQYLYNVNEPRDSWANDTPAELEAELLENSYSMRRHLRHIAGKVRNHSW